MTNLREAAQMALDALELVDDYVMGKDEAKEALRAALAQPEQERDRGGACVASSISGVLTIPLPGKPGGGGISPEPPCATGSQCVGNKCERCAVQEREWVGLTDEERREYLFCDPIFGMAVSTFARAIEAKLKEKNNE